EIIDVCPSLKTENDKMTGKGKGRREKCHYCGKPGHWAKECRKRKNDGERRRQGETDKKEN
ncbi:MAG: C2HC-type zinc finger protein, partial [Cetobacterium sp.]